MAADAHLTAGDKELGKWLDEAADEIDRLSAALAEKDAGWLPIGSAPAHTEVLVWREDCGQFIAIYTSLSELPLTQREIDECDEKTLFSEDWFTQWPQAIRCDGNEKPTHWRPLPEPPSQQQGEQE